MVIAVVVVVTVTAVVIAVVATLGWVGRNERAKDRNEGSRGPLFNKDQLSVLPTTVLIEAGNRKADVSGFWQLDVTCRKDWVSVVGGKSTPNCSSACTR